MKVYKKGITKFLNTEYRSYSNYILQNRGIPSVLDACTYSERLILLNAPDNYEKTLAVGGRVFQTGQYHHGDASLNQTISKLAREYQTSEPLMLGKGHFGNEVSPKPASPRYTSVKINPDIKKDISKYKHLNIRNEEGVIEHLNLDFPIGLLTFRIGLGVGFMCQILPRKREEILKYLNGEKANLNPYFKNFKGKIEIDPLNKNRWIFSPKVILEDKRLVYTSLPPMLKFSSFLDRLNSLISKIDINVVCNNFSSDTVNVEVIFKNKPEQDILDKFINISKIAVTESITMVYKDRVVEYDIIEDYLNDFLILRDFMYLKDKEYHLNKNKDEFNYLKELANYLKFMLKSKKPSREEIEEYFSNISDKTIVSRLDNFKLRNLHIEKIKEIITEMEGLKEINKSLKEEISICNDKLKDKNINFVSTKKSKVETIKIDDILDYDIDEDELENDSKEVNDDTEY